MKNIIVMNHFIDKEQIRQNKEKIYERKARHNEIQQNTAKRGKNRNLKGTLKDGEVDEKLSHILTSTQEDKIEKMRSNIQRGNV